MHSMSKVIITILVSSCLPLAAWGSTNLSVDGLPSTTPKQRIKKAVLALMLENAAKYRAGDDIQTAETLENQVLESMHTEWGQIEEVPRSLLPAIPEWDGNPYIRGALDELQRKLSADDIDFKLGEEGTRQFIKGESDQWLVSRKIADELKLYAWAGLHPQSPFRGDPEVLTRALRRAHAMTDAYLRTPLRQEDMSINDFFAVYTMMDGLLVLQSGCPDLILPAEKEQWDLAVQKVGDYWTGFIDKHKGWWSDDHPRGFGSFCNHNVTEGMIVQFAGMYLDNQDYKDVGKRVVGLQKKVLFPDGGMGYIRKQNQCFGYQAVNIEKFLRHWELTGDPIAMEILQGTRNFFPITVEPGNTNEWWSGPVWKYQWNSTGYGPYQDIIAGLTGCPYNKAIADQELAYRNGTISSIIAAPYYRSDIKPAKLPTDFIVFDRNIQGPRTRYGRFGTAIVSRDYGDDDSGKMTFAGAIIADPVGERRHPLNSAVMAIYPRVQLKPDQPDWRAGAYLSRNEKNATSVGAAFGALTTSHDLEMTSYAQRVFPVDWSGTQQWISLPDRLVGMVEVFPKSEQQKAFDISGRVRLGYGRSGPLRPKEIKVIDDLEYAYGDLRVRLHDHNYVSIDTEMAGVLRDSPLKSTEIVLSNQTEHKPEQRVYSTSTRHFFTVEIMPEWAKPVDSVDIIRDQDLRGIQVADGAKRYLLLHNTSDRQIKYIADLSSWPRGNFAAQFLGNRNGQLVESQNVKPDQQTALAVPANSHVMLLSSPNINDLQEGLYNFDELLE
ncbi:MAG: hypothetical protein AAGI37_15300 [Planctomycetota bacterium]